jgi:hypothetical protein
MYNVPYELSYVGRLHWIIIHNILEINYIRQKKLENMHKLHFQLLRKFSFCSSTCFGHVLWPATGRYIIEKQAAYVNGKYMYISIILMYSLHDFPRHFVCPDLLVTVGETSYGIRG